MGPNQRQVGETHGPLSDGGGPDRRLSNQTTRMSRERQQTGTDETHCIKKQISFYFSFFDITSDKMFLV